MGGLLLAAFTCHASQIEIVVARCGKSKRCVPRSSRVWVPTQPNRPAFLVTAFPARRLPGILSALARAGPLVVLQPCATHARTHVHLIVRYEPNSPTVPPPCNQPFIPLLSTPISSISPLDADISSRLAPSLPDPASSPSHPGSLITTTLISIRITLIPTTFLRSFRPPPHLLYHPTTSLVSTIDLGPPRSASPRTLLPLTTATLSYNNNN